MSGPSIRTKLFLLVTSVGLISTIVMSWIGFRFARQSLTSQIHQRLETVAYDRAAQLTAYVRQQKERVALVASRTRLRRYLAERLEGKPLEEFLEGSSRIIRDAESSTDEFLAIWITDPHGIVVTTTDEEYLDKDYSTNADYLQGRKEEHLGTPFARDGKFYAHLTAPARTNDGEFLGVVMVLLDVRYLYELLLDTTGLGDSGEVLVGTIEDEELRYLFPSGSNPAQSRVSLARAPAMERAVRADAGRDISVYDGKRVLAAWRSIPYQSPELRRWGMVVKIDETEAYAPISHLRVLQWSAAAILIALGIGAAVPLARRLSQPVVDITEAAESIADGNLTARVAVATSDELGGLANSFNRMTDKLVNINETLEQRVEDRTSELESANSALKQSNAELQQFAYVASHDLKEPLRSISSFSELLRSCFEGKLDEKTGQYIHFILDGARRMEQLIDDLLRYSRVATHGEDFALHSAGKLVGNALKNLSEAIAESKAQIEIAELPQIYGDGGQISRVFQNLIGNAIKFHRPNVTPQITVDAVEENGCWKFRVKDNGIGIKPEYADRVFQIFQRLHSRDKYPGTGIGLAICQRIIQRQGGRIWVEPNENHGSTFFLTIPKENAGTAEIVAGE